MDRGGVLRLDLLWRACLQLDGVQVADMFVLIELEEVKDPKMSNYYKIFVL